MLNSKQISHLKSLAHAIKPVVQIGIKGLSNSVINEIKLNLKAHELIKIQVQENDKANRALILASICEKVGAESINHIGKQIVIYKANDKTKIVLPY
ncbi:YhbY family RNA-binding protein [Methylophilaceae bacterium]|jgi:RNA-binding protein|nr:YhbY family RNA-binding protein [Methylophilaceae bacterium]|tara:strand:+ start:264 stop:554 length:291 start_codon:yes stop_codon:yes gene_type:complete